MAAVVSIGIGRRSDQGGTMGGLIKMMWHGSHSTVSNLDTESTFVTMVHLLEAAHGSKGSMKEGLVPVSR